jgi:hypothetical protein
MDTVTAVFLAVVSSAAMAVAHGMSFITAQRDQPICRMTLVTKESFGSSDEFRRKVPNGQSSIDLLSLPTCP